MYDVSVRVATYGLPTVNNISGILGFSKIVSPEDKPPTLLSRLIAELARICRVVFADTTASTSLIPKFKENVELLVGVTVHG